MPAGNTFLTTFSKLVTLAPATQIRTADTAGAAVPFKLVDTAASFLSSIRPGWIVSNIEVGEEATAQILDVESDTTLLLDKDIIPAALKTYEILMPSRDVIVPGVGQELIIFKIWARDKIGPHPMYGVRLYKEGFRGKQTFSMKETSASQDYFEVTDRLLPTATEYYVVENFNKTASVDYIVEGMDKTLSEFTQNPGSTADPENAP